MAPSATGPSVITSNGASVPLNAQRTLASTPRPGYQGYHHVTWYVGNAKQAASYYVARMGFRVVARCGLETGSRYVASHVVSNGGVTFVLTSPVRTVQDDDEVISIEDRKLLQDVHAHLTRHGDGVKDIAFEVDDVNAVYREAVARGAESVQKPAVIKEGLNGEIVKATIKTFGDTTHTFIDRSRYTGTFLPGYRSVEEDDCLQKFLPSIPLEAIDHCVGNQDWNRMESVCE